MPKHKPIIVSVDDDSLKDIHEVADRLTANGMTVDRVMPITGVITGTCTSAKVPTLQALRGVASVEEQVGVQIPNPDSSVQ